MSDSDDPQQRRRPYTVVLASVLLLACTALTVIFMLLIFGQANDMAAAVLAVNPTSHATALDADQARLGIHEMGVLSLVLGLIFVIMAVALWKPVGDIGARIRWGIITGIAVIAAIYPIHGFIAGGVGYSYVTLPVQYDGHNAVTIRLPHSFETSAVRLDVFAAILLVAIIVLLVLPVTRGYFAKPTLRRPAEDDYVSAYLVRKQQNQ